MVVTRIWSRILLWNVSWEMLKAQMRKLLFPMTLLMPWTGKIINYFLKSETLLDFVLVEAKTVRFSVTKMRKKWSDLSDVSYCRCISAVELIMEIVLFFNWNVNECAGFKTAAEYNAFPIMTSRSLKAWSVRFIPSSPFHCQQTDEDNCTVKGSSGWTLA